MIGISSVVGRFNRVSVSARTSLRCVLVASALMLGALVTPTGCDDPQLEADTRPAVLATTGMIADAVTQIGGDSVRVETLMAPGVDPHLYKASEGDVRRLAGADLILYNGLYLEGKLAEVLSKMRASRPVVAVAEAVPKERRLAPIGFAGEFDPHVWFDVGLWIHACEAVSRELIGLLPQRAADFEKNFERYRNELIELDAWAERELQGISPAGRVLVTAHDAFGYFGQRYGLRVVGLQGLSTVSRAGLKDIERVVKLIVQQNVKAIFVESSVPPQTIEAVQAACAQAGHAVVVGGELYSDSVGPVGSGAETYVGMVRHNVNTIAQALR